MDVQRMIKEMMLDNTGMCRFHRGWAEDLFGDLINHHYHSDIDFLGHHSDMARRFQGRNKGVFWESERVIDIVHTYLKKIQRDGPPEPELDPWVRRFDKDKEEAARAYWEAMQSGIERGLKDPFHETT